MTALDKLQRQKERLAKKEEALETLASMVPITMSDEERIALADKVLRFANGKMAYAVENGRWPKDMELHLFEEVMKGVFGDDLFDLTNRAEIWG